MALDQVILGTIPNNGRDGDDPRTAFTRINNNAKLLDDSGVSGKIAAEREVDDYNLATDPGAWTGSATASNRPPGFGRASIVFLESASGGASQVAVDFATGILASRAFPGGTWEVAPTMTQSTTDYTPGRGMRVGDFGMGSAGLPIADFNLAVTYGRYKVWAPNHANNPDTTYAAWELLVFTYDNEVTQVACRQGDATAVSYMRKRTGAGAGTWGAWRRNVFRGDFGIGDPIAITDPNTATSPGDYSVKGGTANVPEIGGWYDLKVYKTVNEVTQVLYRIGSGSPAIYWRTYLGASSQWSAWVNMVPLGVGQGWQFIVRNVGTNYVNNTGRTIALSYAATADTVGQYLRINVNGGYAGWSSAAYIAGAVIGVQATIPPGANYSVESMGGSPISPYSAELR